MSYHPCEIVTLWRVPTTEITVQHPRRGRVHWRPEALAELWRHRGDDLEAGGVLVGRHLDRGTLEIVAVTGPQSGDERGPRSWVRRDPIHAELVDRARAGAYYYVGDWHSHPHGPVDPSALDLREWSDRAAEVHAHCPLVGDLVGAILRPYRNGAELGTWLVE